MSRRRRAPTPKDDTEKARSANFDNAGNHPVAWRFIGSNLLFASDRLSADFTPAGAIPQTSEEMAAAQRSAWIRGPLLMLRGCAVECLLKARYVNGGNVLAQDGVYVGATAVGDHDLLAWARAAEFPVSSEERSLLKALSYWIVQGRYPVMTKWSDYLSFGPDEVQLARNWDGASEQLWKRLRDRLKRESEQL